DRAGSASGWSLVPRLVTLGRAFNTTSVWLGIAVLTLFFVSYLCLLAMADYSYVQPASAGGYAVVPILGWTFAGEHVTSIGWMGIALISVGVALVSRTPSQTTRTE